MNKDLERIEPGSELDQEPVANSIKIKVDRVPKTFTSLRHRNFQLYFGGQLVSVSGTWMQFIAQG
jgi:hypothetical protein